MSFSNFIHRKTASYIVGIPQLKKKTKSVLKYLGQAVTKAKGTGTTLKHLDEAMRVGKEHEKELRLLTLNTVPDLSAAATKNLEQLTTSLNNLSLLRQSNKANIIPSGFTPKYRTPQQQRVRNRNLLTGLSLTGSAGYLSYQDNSANLSEDPEYTTNGFSSEDPEYTNNGFSAELI